MDKPKYSINIIRINNKCHKLKVNTVSFKRPRLWVIAIVITEIHIEIKEEMPELIRFIRVHSFHFEPHI